MAGYTGVPGKYMGKRRARRIHAFNAGVFWSAISASAAIFLFGWIALGDIAGALAIGSGGLILGALVASCLTDMTSMRIEDRVSSMGLVATLLLWTSMAMGTPFGEGVGYGQQVYGALFGSSESGLLFPSAASADLMSYALWSMAGAVLITVPVFLSVVFGMMAAGDLKFMPPVALYFGWSLGWDFLFLTLLFGGVAGAVMMAWRRVCKMICRRRPGVYPELERMSLKKTLAYGPAISVAGLVCLVAKWEGIFA